MVCSCLKASSPGWLSIWEGKQGFDLEGGAEPMANFAGYVEVVIAVGVNFRHSEAASLFESRLGSLPDSFQAHSLQHRAAYN